MKYTRYYSWHWCSRKLNPIISWGNCNVIFLWNFQHYYCLQKVICFIHFGDHAKLQQRSSNISDCNHLLFAHVRPYQSIQSKILMCSSLGLPIYLCLYGYWMANLKNVIIIMLFIIKNYSIWCVHFLLWS